MQKAPKAAPAKGHTWTVWGQDRVWAGFEPPNLWSPYP